MEGKFKKGAEWRKWDLHVHTPCSVVHRYGKNDEETWERFISDLEHLPQEFAVIGVNDYLFLDGYKKLLMEQETNNRLSNVVLFPVVEFRIEKFAGIDFGPLNRINLHVIFSNELTTDTIQSQFLNTLEQSYQLDSGEKWTRCITRKSVEELGKKIKSTIPCEQITKFGSDLEEGFNNLNIKEDQIFSSLNKDCFEGKYLIAIGKTEWSELKWTDSSIATKKSIINNASIVFTSAESIDAFYRSKEKLTSQMVNDLLLDCSDAHCFSDTYEKDRIGNCYTWIKADPTFDGLRHALKEKEERIFIGETPYIFDKVASHRTKYIRELSINSIEGYNGDYGIWFNNIKIPFNKELIAIIGNKGSGKSAITDIISLCSNYQNDEDFSFLTNKKFREKSGRLSKNFEATLTWESNISNKKNLNDVIDNNELLTVKYIPQGLFEKLTNEISTIERFQDEIENVVFSHIPESERLGSPSFKDLVTKKVHSVDSEIEVLKNDVFALNKRIIELEVKTTQAYRVEAMNKVKSKEEELNALEEPLEVKNPNEDNEKQRQNAESNEKIRVIKDNIIKIENEIEEKTNQKKTILNVIQRITSIKHELQQKELMIKNFLYDNAKTLTEFGINNEKLISFVIDYSEMDTFIKKNQDMLSDIQKLLGDIIDINTKSLQETHKDYQTLLAVETAKLDEDQKKYQDYLMAIDKLNKQKKAIIGDEATSDTLIYLQKEVDYLSGKLFDDLNILYSERREVVRSIYNRKQEVIKVYKDMRNKLNSIIEENAHLLKDYIILIDASIEKVNNFNELFLQYIDKGKVGTFYTKEGGEAQLKLLISDVNFDNEESVLDLLDNLINALKHDQRQNQNNVDRDIKDQVRDVSALYNYLFSLEFLEYKYQLRQGEKNLDQLSPGERGALLLVFYLLLDKNDIPLIIDQPEDNLDNHSVAKILVPFMKAAKKKRQIIMVTHNPNLAVVSDAEQVIYVELDKKNYKFSTTMGSIENKNVNRKIVEVLEGAMPAFNTRKNKYFEQ